MLCKIAELVTELPAAGGMAPRCEAYLYTGESAPEVVIREEDYKPERYARQLTAAQLAYMETGWQFYSALLEHNGFYLHSSAIAKDGKAYLFSGMSGTGKSTHTGLWQQEFGDEAVVFNDDKPALRMLDGVWYAYGTPWSGKHGINRNMKVPLAGICFLKQSQRNHIRRLELPEAMQLVLSQTIWRQREVERLDLLLGHLENLLAKIPVFELENRPEPAAAHLSHDTMRQAAEEMNL